MAEVYFLTLAEVVAIHSDQISRYGGEAGIRDMGLLESAIAQPQASYGGQHLHRDVYEMAAAYAFHICQNHPFFDGNKRVGFFSALAFLRVNDLRISDPDATMISVMLDVAQSKITKAELAALLRKLAHHV